MKQACRGVFLLSCTGLFLFVLFESEIKENAQVRNRPRDLSKTTPSVNPFSTQASGGKNISKKLSQPAGCPVIGRDWPGSNSLAVSTLSHCLPTVATLPILAILCTEKRLKTLQSVWRHFVLKTHKKLCERTRLYRIAVSGHDV